MHEDPIGRYTHLASISEFGGHQAFDRFLQISVAQYNKRRVAAELQRHSFDALCRATHQLFANFDRTRNEIFLTRASSRKALPIALGSPVTRLKTPGGIPASANARATANPVSAVCLDGLTIAVHPAAKAAAAVRAIIYAGKFHGVITATTPTGCRIVSKRLSGSGSGIHSP